LASESRKSLKKTPLRNRSSTPGGSGSVRYRIELKRSAERSLAEIENPARVRIARKIDALADNPRPPGVEEMKGTEDLWRIRAGDYRVIYSIQDDILLILVVHLGHRREVYRDRVRP